MELPPLIQRVIADVSGYVANMTKAADVVKGFGAGTAQGLDLVRGRFADVEKAAQGLINGIRSISQDTKNQIAAMEGDYNRLVRAIDGATAATDRQISGVHRLQAARAKESQLTQASGLARSMSALKFPGLNPAAEAQYRFANQAALEGMFARLAPGKAALPFSFAPFGTMGGSAAAKGRAFGLTDANFGLDPVAERARILGSSVTSKAAADANYRAEAQRVAARFLASRGLAADAKFKTFGDLDASIENADRERRFQRERAWRRANIGPGLSRVPAGMPDAYGEGGQPPPGGGGAAVGGGGMWNRYSGLVNQVGARLLPGGVFGKLAPPAMLAYGAKQIWDGITKGIGEFVAGVKAGVSEAVRGAVAGLKTVVGGVVGGLETLVGGLTTAFQTTVHGFFGGDFVAAPVRALATALGAAVRGLGQAAAGVITGTTGAVGAALSGAGKVIAGAIKGVSTALGGLISGGSLIAGGALAMTGVGLPAGIAVAVGGMVVGAIVKAVGSALGGLVGSVAEFAGKVVAAVGEAVGKAVGWVAESISKVLATAGGMAADALGGLVRAGMEAQKFSTTLGVLVGDAERGKKVFGELQALSIVTPFTQQQLGHAAETLLLMGTSSDRLKGTLTALGNISLGDPGRLHSLVELYGEVMNEGRISTRRLFNLSRLGITPRQMAQTMGVSTTDFWLKMRGPGIPSDVLRQTITRMNQPGGQANNMMGERLNQAVGQWTRLQNLIDTTVSKMGKAFVESSGLAEMIRAVGDFLEKNGKRLVDFAEEAGRAFMKIAHEIGTVGVALFQTVTGMLPAAGGEISTEGIQQVIDAVINFGTNIAQGAAAVGAILADLVDAVAEIIRWVRNFPSRLASAAKGGLLGGLLGGLNGAALGVIFGSQGGEDVGRQIPGPVADIQKGLRAGPDVVKKFGDDLKENIRKGREGAGWWQGGKPGEVPPGDLGPATPEQWLNSVQNALERGEAVAKAQGSPAERLANAASRGSTEAYETFARSWAGAGAAKSAEDLLALGNEINKEARDHLKELLDQVKQFTPDKLKQFGLEPKPADLD